MAADVSRIVTAAVATPADPAARGDVGAGSTTRMCRSASCSGGTLRRRAHHQVLGALVLGERDDLADAVLVGEHADHAVDARARCRRAAARRTGTRAGCGRSSTGCARASSPAARTGATGYRRGARGCCRWPAPRRWRPRRRPWRAPARGSVSSSGRSSSYGMVNGWCMKVRRPDGLVALEPRELDDERPGHDVRRDQIEPLRQLAPQARPGWPAPPRRESATSSTRSPSAASRRCHRALQLAFARNLRERRADLAAPSAAQASPRAPLALASSVSSSIWRRVKLAAPGARMPAHHAAALDGAREHLEAAARRRRPRRRRSAGRSAGRACPSRSDPSPPAR